MQLIEHYEVPSGGVSLIVLDEIPADYTDLLVKLSLRSTTAQSGARQFAYIEFNGSRLNVTGRLLEGDGSSAGSFTSDNQIAIVPSNLATANTYGSIDLYIPNYRSSANKSFSVDVVQETNGGTAYQQIRAQLWSQTAAITSLGFYSLTGNLEQYSSATLYGITAGSDGIVAVS